MTAKPQPQRPTSLLQQQQQQHLNLDRDEHERHTAGQRRINAIWEYTQACIAIGVIFTTCMGMAIGKSTPVFQPEWWTIVGLVIGFYFGRTNHTRIGTAGKSA